MNQVTKVFVVDDDPGVRNLISELVKSAGLLPQAYQSGEDFLRDYDASMTGCVVTDVRMHGLDGLELQRRLAEFDPSLPVVMISGHGDIPMAVQAMERGAVGFLEKPFKSAELLDLVRRALERDREQRLRLDERQIFVEKMARLTSREQEVMDALVAGKTPKQIAQEFGVSIQTVARHRTSILEKIEVDNDVELVHALIQFPELVASA